MRGNRDRPEGSPQLLTAPAGVEDSALFSREDGADYPSFLSDWLDESPVATLLMDSDFRIVWINHPLERYWGMPRTELVGKDSRQLVRDRIRHLFDDPERFAQTVLAAYDDNRNFLSFICHLLPEGERKERWLMHWSNPIRRGPYAGGRVEHYIDMTPCKRLEGELIRNSASLAERIKELTCLLDIARLIEEGQRSFAELLQAIVDRIPLAWQHPEETCARLILDGQEFQSGNFRESVWQQAETVSVNAERIGLLEVHRLGQFAAGDEPFLEEEGQLMHALAHRIGRLAERKMADEALRARAVELEELNTTLRVLLTKMQEERQQFKEKILYSVEELVLPYLGRLNQGRLDPQESALLNLVISNLSDITSPFIENLVLKYSRLTSAEIEVASLIRAGRSTQEIADLLHVSVRTVESHRQHIRHKLGLKGHAASLRLHLLSSNPDYGF